ncbi:beta-amyloid-like protein, partial [Leptotrombidium deliense]
VYPKKDIRNIVESNKYFKIENWCKVGQKKCRAKHWVKPYRCLEGPFQSDALLVPEHCLFDHIHNQSICQASDYWNRTATFSCDTRVMKLQSYAMLLPCGVGVFSGVEFVCCPPSQSSSTSNTLDVSKDKEEEDDDSDENYLSHFDSTHERDSFKIAQKSLEKSHSDKVMKEWSDFEERYRKLRAKDPKQADEMKKKMTASFQKTVEALEEEGAAEKRQLLAMHQQRIMTIINMRKKSAMNSYTQSLDQKTPKPKRIEKYLKKLLRYLEKDRTHTLHHFRDLLNSNTKQALREKDALLDHLENLVRMGNQSIQMLNKVDSLSGEIRGDVIDYWYALRGASEPMTRESEQKVMEKFEEEVAQKQQDRERQKMIYAERRQELKELQEEKKRLSGRRNGKLEREFDPESMEDEHPSSAPVTAESDENGDSKNSGHAVVPPTIVSPVATSLNDRKEDDLKPMPTPKVSHIHNQPIHYNEVTYSVRREPYHRRMINWNSSLYITLAFAGIALLTATIVGVVLLRRHTQRSPHSQGFVEVDQSASPEERHVANMQINGYENPTYKYFEAQHA